MSVRLLKLLYKLNHSVFTCASFRRRNPNLLLNIINDDYTLDDIKYVVQTLGYTVQNLHDKSQHRVTHELRSAASSKTIEILKWLLTCTSDLNQDDMLELLKCAITCNTCENIIGFIDDDTFSELMKSSHNMTCLHYLFGFNQMLTYHESKQLAKHFIENHLIHFTKHNNFKYYNGESKINFYETMIELKYAFFLDPDIKSKKIHQGEADFFKHLNNNKITQADQKKLLDYVIQHNLRGHLLNRTIFKKLDVSVIEALYKHQAYGEYLGIDFKHAHANIEPNLKMLQSTKPTEPLFMVNGITYHGDRDQIYEKLRVLAEWMELAETSGEKFELLVLTFSLCISDENKVINTMINMILGLNYEELNFDDVIGLLDLHHKYDGTFIALDELEYLIMNKN
jgi:hypothetical protein